MLSSFWSKKAQQSIQWTKLDVLLFGSPLKYIFCSFFFSKKNYFTICAYGLQEGCLEVAKFLIENGAQIDRAEDRGLTPLWTASAVCVCLCVCVFLKM